MFTPYLPISDRIVSMARQEAEDLKGINSLGSFTLTIWKNQIRYCRH